MDCDRERIADARPGQFSSRNTIERREGGVGGGLFGRFSATDRMPRCSFRHYKRGGVPKMSRLISLRVFSLFKTSPHPLLRLSLDHLERQKQPGAAKADRYMSWEVHIESPGIHLFLKEKKPKKKQGKKRERMGF